MREDDPARFGPFSLTRKISMTNEEVLQTLAHLVGTRYVPELKGTICALTGRTRVVGPNEMSTRDYDAARIQIKADADLMIQSFAFN
ncbi:hypothetical protein D3C76_753780 [compost metagenome]|jgi:2-iminoacetate synthase ThiH